MNYRFCTLLLIAVVFPFVLCSAQFRFALITDIHISQLETSSEDLRRAVAQINATPGLDFVLVTGDITEEGDKVSMLKAKSMLDEFLLPYYVIPGNHETTWSASGMTAFSEVFGSERVNFQHKGFLFIGFNSGPFIRMADGHVAPQDIRWLADELKSYGTDKPVVLVTHYPLKEGDVDNWYEVIDAIRPYNIRMCVGGHYHANHEFRYDGIPGFLNRSTLRAKEDVGGYSLYEITTDSIVVYEQLIGGEPRRWGALSLTDNYNDADRIPDARPDFSVNDVYSQVREAWLLRTQRGIYSSPIVSGNCVYVGDDVGYLTCYDLSDGAQHWQFKAGNRIVGTPAVADGVVVFGSVDACIYGLDARTGSERWKIQAAGPVMGAVNIEGGKAYIGASDHVFRAIDIHTGQVDWMYSNVEGYVVTKPLVANDLVIFGAWDNTLYALNKDTGAEQWRWTGGLTRMHFSPASVWPVSAHGMVFIADPQRALTAIDLKTGETIYRTFNSMVRETIGLSEDQSQIYSKTMQDSLVCYDATTRYPKQIWACDVGFGYEHAPSMPLEKDGVVVGGTKNGVIFGVDACTGRLLWKHKVGNSLVNTVLPLSGKRVLVTTTAGEVALLDVQEDMNQESITITNRLYGTYN